MQEKLKRKLGLRFEWEGDGLIIRDAENNATFLDLVAGRIWELCDGRNTIDDIARIIAYEFDEDLETVYKDIVSFIKELRKKNFLEQ